MTQKHQTHKKIQPIMVVFFMCIGMSIVGARRGERKNKKENAFYFLFFRE